MTYIYSSTYFGRRHAHRQELKNCRSSLWFYLRSRSRRRPRALLPPRSNGKTRGCYCICWAPDVGREDTRNML